MAEITDYYARFFFAITKKSCIAARMIGALVFLESLVPYQG